MPTIIDLKLAVQIQYAGSLNRECRNLSSNSLNIYGYYSFVCKYHMIPDILITSKNCFAINQQWSNLIIKSCIFHFLKFEDTPVPGSTRFPRHYRLPRHPPAAISQNARSHASARQQLHAQQDALIPTEANRRNNALSGGNQDNPILLSQAACLQKFQHRVLHGFHVPTHPQDIPLLQSFRQETPTSPSIRHIRAALQRAFRL